MLKEEQATILEDDSDNWHEEHSVRPRYRLGAEESCQPRGGDSRGRGHP